MFMILDFLDEPNGLELSCDPAAPQLSLNQAQTLSRSDLQFYFTSYPVNCLIISFRTSRFMGFA
jgi:hypothetical protein